MSQLLCPRCEDGGDFLRCSTIFCRDHPDGEAELDGRWILRDKNGKALAYGTNILDAMAMYVKRTYQNPVKPALSHYPKNPVH